MLLISALVVALLPACSRREALPEVEPAPAVSAGAPTDSAGAGEGTGAPTILPEISIQRVSAANPLVIEGRARTFENNVVVRVRDARGRLIVEDFVTSTGEMGQHNPFRAELFITRDPGGRVTAEALEYSAKDGSERSLTSSTVSYAAGQIQARLFFPARNPGDCSDVKGVMRTMPNSVSMARLLAEALLHGPLESEGELSNPFPKGSDVDSVVLRNGILTVDLNDRLRNVGGSCAALAIRASIERTMKTLPSVREVVITAGGSRELALQP